MITITLQLKLSRNSGGGGVGGTGHRECRGGDWRRARRKLSFHQNIHFFWLEGNGWKRGVGAAVLPFPSSIGSLVYLDSLLMTLMRAPFSSFSRWLSDFSSVNTCRGTEGKTC